MMEEQKFDNINHPARYCRNGVECIDVIDAVVANLDGEEAIRIGNAVKYLFRFKDKGCVEDLRKAIRYIEMAIEYEEKKERKEKENTARLIERAREFGGDDLAKMFKAVFENKEEENDEKTENAPIVYYSDSFNSCDRDS